MTGAVVRSNSVIGANAVYTVTFTPVTDIPVGGYYYIYMPADQIDAGTAP